MVALGGTMTGGNHTAGVPRGQTSFGTAGNVDTDSVTVQRLPYGTLFSVCEPPLFKLKVVLRVDGGPQVRPIGKLRAFIVAFEALVPFLTFFSTTTWPTSCFGHSGMTIVISPEQHRSVPSFPPPTLVALAVSTTVWPAVAPVTVQVVVADQGCCGGVTVTPSVCDVMVMSMPAKLDPFSVTV